MLQRTLLHVIQNMEIGGAQRSASTLMNLPGVQAKLVNYGQLSALSRKHYSALLLHVWCSQRDKDIMNWPEQLGCDYDQLIVFNHDWRGSLDVGADAYIVYSRFAFDNSRADAEMHVVSGGIPLGIYNQLTTRHPQGPAVVGRLSTLLDGKISVDLITFWREISASRFVIAGEGPRRAELLSAFSDDLRFEFPGSVKPIDVPRFLKKLDIFLYDTSWHTESFCYVILEAMAAGCVVVAKEKGAVPELITHGVNGFLYTSNDQAIALCNGLISNVNLRVKVANRARTFASHYSLERFRSGVLSVLGWVT